MKISCISHLECSKCGKKYDYNKVNQLCECGKPLLVKYDLEKVKEKVSPEDIAKREHSLWRYKELLPVVKEENIVSLGEGMTPLNLCEKSGKKIGIPNLYIKDEGVIPTGSFKARGAAVGVSKAKEVGVKTLAMATNGNAGAAWSMYSAKAGIESVIVMPDKAPMIARNECAVNGCNLHLIDGLISDAGKVIGQLIQKNNWFDVSTLKEPYRIEGKKTMGFEICEQMDWSVPDVIVYPTGGGVGLIGIYKALKELQELGWIGEKMPRLVAVQSSGCSPIVKAWENNRFQSEFFEDSKTIAFGINVPKALGDYIVLDAIYETNGCAVEVDDEKIMEGIEMLAKNDGQLVCPEGACAFMGAVKLRENGWIKENEKVVVLNTGNGVKYLNMINFDIPYI